jgi:pimeloyl-ACP methyl ester carboxylesterase
MTGAGSALRWETTEVSGRRAAYGRAEPTVGDGVPPTPVVFLHGWGLTGAAYGAALATLSDAGHPVLVPDLPGFGGSAGLGGAETSFPGYAAWVERFLDAVGVTGPIILIGHSFGGGVATSLASRLGSRVERLVLLNAVGAGTWLLGFPGDLFDPRGVRSLPTVIGEAVPNLLRNPWAVLMVGNLARTADLAPELRQLAARRVPVAVVWSERDHIVPRSSFEATCQMLGTEGQVVRGPHAWMLTNPGRFSRVVGALISPPMRQESAPTLPVP